MKSGKVEGYIKSDYVLTGSDALNQASSLLKKVADVNTEGLKVRTEPSTESEVLDIVGSDQSFDVLEELDEWVKIDLDGDEGYLYKDYVNVGAKLEGSIEHFRADVWFRCIRCESGTEQLCKAVHWKSLCMGWNQPDQRR